MCKAGGVTIPDGISKAWMNGADMHTGGKLETSLPRHHGGHSTSQTEIAWEGEKGEEREAIVEVSGAAASRKPRSRSRHLRSLRLHFLSESNVPSHAFLDC